MRVISAVLLCLAIKQISTSSEDEEMLPSDAPMTMMDRINTAKVMTAHEEVRLTTTLGTIVGLREPSTPPHVSNTHHYAFRGIPYAKPPVGDLRFTDPIDLEGPWPSESFNATRFRSFCLQYNVMSKTILGAEDCLYLNVYTPVIPGETEDKELLPVFVFIHGGAYIRGSSSAHGAEKLLSRDLVVVTLNYRLGALGFLSMGDSVLPGNYGMLDQVSALRWVNRHIAEFGGNPNQVTVGGFSAGATSTSLHMHSPLSKDLFHRAILMSGTASCAFAVQEDPLTPARLLAAELSCPVSPSSALSACVASKDYKDIIKAQASIFNFEFSPSWFAAVVDQGLRANPFLPLPVTELETRPIPTIVGTVPQEALLFAANAIVMTKDIESTSDLYDNVVPESFLPWELEPQHGALLHHLGESFYYNSHARISKDSLLEQFVEALTDRLFVKCIWDTAADLANTGSPTYMYMMTHRDPESASWAMPLYQQLWDMGYTTPLLKEGISHGDDVVHLFNFPYAMDQGTHRDKRVTDIIVSVITNFIIDGEPKTSTGPIDDLPEWTPVVPGQVVSYYDINVNPSMIYKPFRAKERNFWRSTIPKAIAAASSNTGDSQRTLDSQDACPV